MEPIPIAIVGLNFGRHIAHEIAHGEAGRHMKLAAVCDIDEDKARQHADEYQVPFYTDLDQLLANDDIPAIGLFTGPGGRAELLDRIVDAGKDVMTTKPFELDCDAGLAVLRKAKGLGRVIHLNSPSPVETPDFKLIRQWQKTHRLGKPVGCSTSVWVRYREVPDGRWYDDPGKCPVAPVFRIGIYLINDLVRVFGEAERVSVFSSRMFSQRPTADNAQLSILFKSGALASVFASFCVEDGDHHRLRMVLNFERGTVYRNADPARNSRPGADLALVMGSRDVERALVESEQVDRMSGDYQWDNFAAAVRGESIDETTTPESIVSGLRIIEAMGEAEKGQGVAEVRRAV